MESVRKHALLAATAICLAFAQPSFAASTEVWNRDVQEIINDILATHPDPFNKVGETTWRRKAKALQTDIPQLSEEQRVVRLMQLVASIGDGHTQIDLDSNDYAQWYPIRIFEFSDGYYVTSAHRSHSSLAGAQIISIGGQPVDAVMKKARSVMGADNEFDAKERLFAVHNAFLMRGLGFAADDGSLEFTFRLRNGRRTSRTLAPTQTPEGFYPGGVPIFEWRYREEVYGLPFDSRDNWVSAFNNLPSSAFEELDETRPPLLQHRIQYTRRAMPEQDAYFLQFNQTDDSGMNVYMNEALQEIDAQRPKHLIIDIRHNFGGDGSTLPPMMHRFVERRSDQPWGDIYLVTGPKTFSAGVMMIDAFLDNTDVNIIGEPAGAALNSFGDATRVYYPDIGLRLEVSTLRHQLSSSDDLRAFIPVDTPAPLSFADYIAGRDTAIDQVLNGEEMRAIPTIALREGGARAREIYQARQEQFGDLSWHRPPEEIALRRVMDELIAQERYKDALETAKLNSEIHPFIWNVWYNLATAQNAAGAPHQEQRYRSYKCVALLAPNNWNVPAINNLFEREGIDPAPAEGCPVGAS